MFKNEDEMHFRLACPLYNRPRVTLLSALAHIAPFIVRALLYGNDNLELGRKQDYYTRNTKIYKRD